MAKKVRLALKRADQKCQCNICTTYENVCTVHYMCSGHALLMFASE